MEKNVKYKITNAIIVLPLLLQSAEDYRHQKFLQNEEKTDACKNELTNTDNFLRFDFQKRKQPVRPDFSENKQNLTCNR
jgi:hypothetical protein